ncbi:MBL fold metallo-hydrolase RNA specificity domain-containing protein [Clostridium sp. Marseille-P2415]|uniref:MBL fold metallo-hydrolase RNA specificity domain-containing protein n=1 Tax=Clostridium sp. Marseille-P2415 TaxID=1805471 RepID=UPI0009884781|nr:MBL fold metallo-hydrolase [Clostridium sp. Marseille-P2415]
MKLMFIGAAHEVTGSCHYLEAAGFKVLVDCGMEQGIDKFENVDLPVSFAEIDYVLLTHAHIDHAGMLPFIYARGFRGQVISTEATADLCGIMLKDSAHIQESETEWKNRKARRAGMPEEEPLYGINDAMGVLELFHSCNYEEKVELEDGFTIRFVDVGHLLGSASIEVWITEGGSSKKIVFSGDIGNKNKPLIRDPQYIKDADYVVMECTYGDRLHGMIPDHVSVLADMVQRTLDRGGNVVIPAFAVGRTQELLYMFRRIKAEKRINGHEGFEVYVDSPLAVEATHVFKDNLADCYDEETRKLVMQGVNPISFPGLKLSVTSEESKNINFNSKPKVIISAAGMCDAGRIRHHLKHNLWRPECTVVFTGYQSIGTLGRSLIEGLGEVRLFGETIQVEAHIEQMDGMSSHADMEGLITWLNAFEKKPRQVFLVHGDDQVCKSFEQLLEDEYGYKVKAPYSGSVYDLSLGRWLNEAEGIVITKIPESPKKPAGVYGRLFAAGERLLQVIRHNQGGANKDLAKFADQINSLCDKWDR